MEGRGGVSRSGANREGENLLLLLLLLHSLLLLLILFITYTSSTTIISAPVSSSFLSLVSCRPFLPSSPSCLCPFLILLPFSCSPRLIMSNRRKGRDGSFSTACSTVRGLSVLHGCLSCDMPVEQEKQTAEGHR
eukprot:757084-Hanusia_phi.AAC.4